MKLQKLSTPIYAVLFVLLIISCNDAEKNQIGRTTIEKWQDGKQSAVSLTYDDGSANQFKVALPIMNRLELPATFYINTGNISGSKYPRKFIGRPIQEIIRETETIPTNADNLFERASAIRIIGNYEIREHHTRAGSLWESGKKEEAIAEIDKGYALVRADKSLQTIYQPQPGELTWDDINNYAAQGHEFASHTISHPRLSVMDEPNLLYELEKSKEDILNNMGAEYTFSVECPYGTEDERVMEYMYERYEASRNRMPEPYLEELNRGNREHPGSFDREYVQWQRGALSGTSLDQMKSWIDTSNAHNNIWLVLVFHGVDGVGWEAIPGDTLDAYFRYIKSNEDKVWVATFKDVTKYIRERMHAEVTYSQKNDQISVQLKHDLDPSLYDLPLTLKTYIPTGWKAVELRHGDLIANLIPLHDKNGYFVRYRAMVDKDILLLNSEL
jgi:peptidoglycan/xylan/chitin deacetylase (PgdA/CDA1 family)